MNERTAKRLAKIRDGGVCRICYRRNVWRLQVHHIKPIAQGGHPTDLRNLITLCVSCHQGIVHAGDIGDGAKADGNWRRWTLTFSWLIRTKPVNSS